MCFLNEIIEGLQPSVCHIRKKALAFITLRFIDIIKNMEPILVLPKGQFTPLRNVTVQGLIGAFVNLVLVAAAILFVFNFLVGGIKFILSGGAKDKTEDARRHIVNAIIGIAIVLSVYAGMSFLSQFYGIDLFTFEIPTL